jgi:chromosome segregation ATPase
MATVLSLKELRSTAILKEQIRQLEEDKLALDELLERQKQVEQKLREEILERKKDFEHLEKQFDHFAGIEAEFEDLQQQVQLERLEAMIESDKKDAQLKAQVKKTKEDLKVLQDELKELKALDPMRLKRQVVDLKKKTATQQTENTNLNTALVTARKELKSVTAEKEKLETDLKSAKAGLDFFWQSKDGNWSLFESTLRLKDEEAPEDSKRVMCLNNLTGISVVSNGLDENDHAQWLGAQELPEEVSVEAGKRLKLFAAEAEEAQAKD